jgi:fluoroquinolone transport system permease protein
MHTIRALGSVDAASVRRDSLLWGMLLVPLGLALATRWLLPGLFASVGRLVGIDIMLYYGAFFGYVLLLLPPAICGMVVGFLLLDQRDEQTLLAMRVTPLPFSGYLAYRLALPMLLSLLMTLLALPLAGVTTLSLAQLLPLVLLAAPLAPLLALFLAAFAANKVQGFALQKLMGLLLVGPAVAAFVPEPWRYLFGLMPTATPAALLWTMEAGAPFNWLVWLGGLVYQGLLLALLLRKVG